MKQIKTIAYHLDKIEKFDAKVNAAIADGWTLTNRTILLEQVLFAELERVTVTEAERCCDNCAYCDCSGHEEPCFSCEDASNWADPEEWEK